MRVLEARFRSGGIADAEDGEGFVVVGRIVWRQPDPAAAPIIQADPSLVPGGTPPLVEKLRYLVRAMAPNAYQRLQALQSRFWSFVDVTAQMEKGGP
jgi:hypothetical protein